MKTEVEGPASDHTQGRTSALVGFLTLAKEAGEELRDMAMAVVELRTHLDAVEFAADQHHTNVVRLLNDIRRGESPPMALTALDTHTGRLLGAIEQLAAAARELERGLQAAGPHGLKVSAGAMVADATSSRELL